jgi:hypothetical protein
VDHLDHVPVLDPVDGLLHRQVLSVRTLDDPPVVDVLVGVAGDLLLVGGAAAVRISGGGAGGGKARGWSCRRIT